MKMTKKRPNCYGQKWPWFDRNDFESKMTGSNRFTAWKIIFYVESKILLKTDYFLTILQFWNHWPLSQFGRKTKLELNLKISH